MEVKREFVTTYEEEKHLKNLEEFKSCLRDEFHDINDEIVKKMRDLDRQEEELFGKEPIAVIENTGPNLLKTQAQIRALSKVQAREWVYQYTKDKESIKIQRERLEYELECVASFLKAIGSAK